MEQPSQIQLITKWFFITKSGQVIAIIIILYHSTARHRPLTNVSIRYCLVSLVSSVGVNVQLLFNFIIPSGEWRSLGLFYNSCFPVCHFLSICCCLSYIYPDHCHFLFLIAFNMSSSFLCSHIHLLFPNRLPQRIKVIISEHTNLYLKPMLLAQKCITHLA